MQKDIKINQKEIERMQKILDENKEKEGSKVEENYKVVKENMENLQKEINDLNQIKLEHKNCTKNINILKNKLNVLFIDMELPVSVSLLKCTTTSGFALFFLFKLLLYFLSLLS